MGGNVVFLPILIALGIVSYIFIKFFNIDEKIALVLAYITMVALALMMFDTMDALMILFLGLLTLIWIVSIESRKQE